MSQHITIFSPEGKLQQVEYAFKAAEQSGLNSVAVCGDTCVCVVVQKKVPDPLIEAESVTSLFAITNAIGCLATGYSPDIVRAVQRLREEAAEFRYKNGYDIEAESLSRRIANIRQVSTQNVAIRVEAVALTLFSIGEETSAPELFTCDPAGHYCGYRAVAAGPKGHEMMALLERETERGTSRPAAADEAVRLALRTLVEALGQKQAADTIEIGLVEKDTRSFRRLGSAETAEVLSAEFE